MENNLPQIKIYNIDYDFIVKNYLDPNMWGKTWTLFVYKTFIVTLRLRCINFQNEKLEFTIKVEDMNEKQEYYDCWGDKKRDKYRQTIAEYSLKIDSVDFLKREIESRVFDAIEYLENDAIRALDEYQKLKKSETIEESKLRQIAEDFLDTYNISNEDIRESYIGAYISNCQEVKFMIGKLESKQKYTIFPDFYLAFAYATKDEKTITKWEYKLSDIEDISELKENIIEYLEFVETENFMTEMSEKLEDI